MLLEEVFGDAQYALRVCGARRRKRFSWLCCAIPLQAKLAKLRSESLVVDKMDMRVVQALAHTSVVCKSHRVNLWAHSAPRSAAKLWCRLGAQRHYAMPWPRTSQDGHDVLCRWGCMGCSVRTMQERAS